MKSLSLTLIAVFALAGNAAGQTDTTLSQGTVEAEFRRNAAWVLGRVNLENEYFLYLDTSQVAITLLTDRVRRTGSGYDLWVTWYYKEPRSARYGSYQYDHVLEHMIVTCTSRRWGTLRSVAYRNTEVVDDVQSPTSPPRMEEMLPNSVGEAMLNNLCHYVQRRN
jgi:hypothetical protein